MSRCYLRLEGNLQSHWIDSRYIFVSREPRHGWFWILRNSQVHHRSDWSTRLTSCISSPPKRSRSRELSPTRRSTNSLHLLISLLSMDITAFKSCPILLKFSIVILSAVTSWALIFAICRACYCWPTIVMYVMVATAPGVSIVSLVGAENLQTSFLAAFLGAPLKLVELFGDGDRVLICTASPIHLHIQTQG